MFRRFIVAESTGCYNLELSERLYMHYAKPEAWAVVPDAAAALREIKRSGAHLKPSIQLHHPFVRLPAILNKCHEKRIMWA